MLSIKFNSLSVFSMEKNERMNVVQKCTHCERPTQHTVICNGVDHGVENRTYTCDDCQHSEDYQVEHRVTLHDKLRKQHGTRL